MKHYKRTGHDRTLVMSVTADSYSVADTKEPEPDGFTGSPASYEGWQEISAVDATALLGWDVTA